MNHILKAFNIHEIKQHISDLVLYLIFLLLWFLSSYAYCRLSCNFIYILFQLLELTRRGSAAGIVTGYGLNDRDAGVRVPLGSRIIGLNDRGVGVRVPLGSRIITSPYRPYRLCGPLSFLPNGYWGSFSMG
jgi:hypothetical protein